MNVTADKVLKVAKEWLGYCEKDKLSDIDIFDKIGHGNYTIFAQILDSLGDFYNGPKQGYAWCDVYVDCCVFLAADKDKEAAMYVLCQPKRSAGAGCLYSAQYYKQAGRWSTKPQVGAQIFFSYQAGEVSHTGLVESFTTTTVNTIEGNTSDKVARRTYSINDPHIYGYGLPRYGEVNGGGSSSIVVPTPTPATTPVGTCSIKLPQLSAGMTGYVVLGMQGILIARGYGCGPDGADGDFGTNTVAAVKAFQRKNGLTADGIIGSATWAKLLGGTKI